MPQKIAKTSPMVYFNETNNRSEQARGRQRRERLRRGAIAHRRRAYSATLDPRMINPFRFSLLAFCICVGLISSGCQPNFETASLYGHEIFERELVASLEENGFSIVEMWVNAEHLRAIPTEIVVLHGDVDEEKSRFTTYFVAESEDKEIMAIRYWVIGDQVGALTLFSTQEETARSIRSDLDRRLPGMLIDVEIKGDAAEVRNAGDQEV
jgi:hypothetical protein